MNRIFITHFTQQRRNTPHTGDIHRARQQHIGKGREKKKGGTTMPGRLKKVLAVGVLGAGAAAGALFSVEELRSFLPTAAAETQVYNNPPPHITLPQASPPSPSLCNLPKALREMWLLSRLLRSHRLAPHTAPHHSPPLARQ